MYSLEKFDSFLYLDRISHTWFLKKESRTLLCNDCFFWVGIGYCSNQTFRDNCSGRVDFKKLNSKYIFLKCEELYE